MYRSEHSNPEIPPFSTAQMRLLAAKLKEVTDARKHFPAIAIDGPGGSGKGTVAKRFRKELNYKELGYGIQARSITWLYVNYFLKDKKPTDNFFDVMKTLQVERYEYRGIESVVITVPGLIAIKLDPKSTSPADGLRSPLIDTHVSEISELPEVVNFINAQLIKNGQKAHKEKTPIIIEGRDNNEIFKGEVNESQRWFDAMLLIYLTASDEVLMDRAVKRETENAKEKGKPLPTTDDIKMIKDRLLERNKEDMARPVGYGRLVSKEEAEENPDYTVIDSSEMNEDEVFFRLMVLQLHKLGIKQDSPKITLAADRSPDLLLGPSLSLLENPF